ncbi:MAG: nucleoid-associated protein [Chitinophagaceae bacterium]|nr:nucleoid-associated protein [Chitinophagaceae bacterium]
MIDITNTNIDIVSAHYVGNKTNGDELLLSRTPIDISDLRLRELLMRFFLSPFPEPEFFSFTFTDNNFSLNPVYNFVSEVFDNKKIFHKASTTIAKYLYEISLHPQIKSGDLFVTYFSDINIDGESTEVIGIFKSENWQSFLKLDTDIFSLQYDDGISIDKLDKGCLIFNIAKEEGYKVCIIDKSNKSAEAQYWKDTFLQIKPCSDNFHNTQQFLAITKNFVTKQFAEDFEVTKTDQIDLLNRSIEYFKTHDAFDKKEFEKEVFYHPEMIKSFRNFDSQYRQNNEIDIEDSFDISPQAVKKQARVFKSVLKLDRNFHIYIHGNKEMIEKGVEKDGRKYYKIYYENES